MTTSFVDSCLETLSDSAHAVVRQSRGRPRARQLLRLLADRKNILITTHTHPDPDALASCRAMHTLLSQKLSGKVSVSIKGNFGGGLNSTFAQYMNLNLLPWEESTLGEYDAILLLDTQPAATNSPLPAGTSPTAVIDHHRSRGRRPGCPFCDIRPEVGATGSILFSYFMDLEVPISSDLAATLLFAIESDLAGLAGQPGELDNIALSSLTLRADTRKLYRMRYVDLPQGFFVTYALGLTNAMYYENALITHVDTIGSPEKPAVLADFLLRFDKVQWSLVTAVSGQSLILSLRTSSSKLSAADMMRRLVRHLGEGGGHRTKAGGVIPLETGSTAEIERLREILRRRYLRALKIKAARGQRLVPTTSR